MYVFIVESGYRESLNASGKFGIPLFPESLDGNSFKLFCLQTAEFLLIFKIDFLEKCGMKFDSVASVVSIKAVAMRQCSATKMGHSGSFRLLDFSHPNWK